MKNIHVLPTDNPSNLFEIDGHLIINRKQLIQPKYYRNIHITSDEEIKEGDWYFDIRLDNLFQCESDRQAFDLYHTGNVKKIILTTDQDLIKDGVQAIDDEFLEWFVKNSDCEFVETRYIVGTYNPDYLKFYEVSPPKSYYKINKLKVDSNIE